MEPRDMETIDADLFDITNIIIDVLYGSTITHAGPSKLDPIHLAMKIAKELRKEGLV